MSKNKKAFSLIEALAGLFILSLIVLYLLPSFYQAASLRKGVANEDFLTRYTLNIMEKEKENVSNIRAETYSDQEILVQKSVTDYGKFVSLRVETKKGEHRCEFETLIKKK